MVESNYRVSIVIPSYNEASNIVALYEQIKKVLSNTLLELLFVDDGSSDNTLSVIESLAHRDSDVKFISFSRNFGHQNALKAGLDFATGDCVISMDADLQHPPELLSTLIEKWKEGYDIVYTIRNDNQETSFFKRTTSRAFYKLINYLSDIDIKPGSADFRLLDRKVVDVLKNSINEYQLFYRGLIPWMGYNQTSIEYFPNKRYSGKSKYSFYKMMNFAIDGITSFSIKPLKMAIMLGIILSVFSALYGLYAIGMSIFTDQTVRGWTSILLSVLFIGGVNMILLGIIGEYIGKIYLQSKNRPHYIIKKSFLNES
jgi:dolichol-phosphate mannosyltransferase